VNPAGAKKQLLGVYDPAWCRPLAETLRALGSEAAWVVHGGGLDELTLAGENIVVALKDGVIDEFNVTAADAGLPEYPAEAISGGDAEHNAAALRALLNGAPGAYRDTVLLNTAAALVVAGRSKNLPAGVQQAAAAIDSGKAANILEALVVASKAQL